MMGGAVISLALLFLTSLVLVSGAAADAWAVCHQKRESFHIPDLIWVVAELMLGFAWRDLR